MNASRLSQITYLFPQNHPEGLRLFQHLAALLGEDPHAQVQAGRVTLTPPYPAGALPVTALALADVPFPGVLFRSDQKIEIQVGGFWLSSERPAPASTFEGYRPPLAEIGIEGESPRQRLDAAELFGRFQGHILWTDHSGIELPAKQVGRQTWQNLLGKLGKVTNLYAYPTGEAFPFILPADQSEFEDGLDRFEAPRIPKFELTYGYVAMPLIQFHLDTRLERQQVEALLPEPFGFDLTGGGTFRSVYLAHPWPGLSIRLDLSFYVQAADNGWSSGEWLARQENRI